MPSGHLLAEQVALALAEERLVEGVVAAPRARGHEAGELRPRVDAGVAERVALEVEEARAGQGLDLLPATGARPRRPRAEDRRGSARPASTSSQVGGRPGREGMRPGTRKTTAFMPCRRSSGAATLHTEPRPSSKVSSTARSGGSAAAPRITATYSSAESVT